VTEFRYEVEFEGGPGFDRIALTEALNDAVHRVLHGRGDGVMERAALHADDDPLFPLTYTFEQAS
jgi:hypothetical protein